MGERLVSEELALTMHATGRRRAQGGKVVPVDVLREMSSKPQRVTEYLYGYMSQVEIALAEIGITTPTQLDIHESFMHIVVRDPELEGISGIRGLADGTQVVKQSDVYKQIEPSDWNHYRDGYKIGFAFARTNIRKGNFEALALEEDIPEDKQSLIKEEIGQWFVSKGITKLDPGVVLHFNPYTRLGFAYRLNNGENGFDIYLEMLSHRHDTNVDVTRDIKETNLLAARRGFNFASRIK